MSRLLTAIEALEAVMTDYAISGPVKLRHFDEWTDDALHTLYNVAGHALAQRVDQNENTFAGPESRRVH